MPDPSLDEQLLKILGGQTQESSQGFLPRFTRGLVSEATLGAFEPYKEEGPGGIPETAGRIAGAGLSFIPLFRGAGLGAAGLSAAAKSSRLIREGMTAGQAVSKLASFKPAVAREVLSVPGRMTASGAAMAAQTLVPNFFSETPGTVAENLSQAALGAGLGAFTEGILARKFKVRLPIHPVPEEEAVVARAAREKIFGTSNRITELTSLRDDAVKQLEEARARHGAEVERTTRAAWSTVIKKWEKRIQEYDNQIKLEANKTSAAALVTPPVAATAHASLEGGVAMRGTPSEIAPTYPSWLRENIQGMVTTEKEGVQYKASMLLANDEIVDKKLMDFLKVRRPESLPTEKLVDASVLRLEGKSYLVPATESLVDRTIDGVPFADFYNRCYY